MLRFDAPYPAVASTILLPSPRIGNVESLTSSVDLIRMSDGSVRTIVRRANDKKLHRFSFLVSRDKMEELRDFIKRYPGALYRAVWRDQTIIGKGTLNPIEASGEGRALGWPGGEAYSMTVEIREV